MCEKYNGYSNKLTWLVSLWLSNDYVSYQYAVSRAEELVEDNDGDKEAAHRTLAAEIKKQHEEGNPAQEASVYSDLMGYALALVDWEEATESFFED